MTEEQLAQYIIRPANAGDLQPIFAFDALASTDAERQAFIRKAVEAKSCLVLTVQEEAIAYIITERHFFGWPFIELIYVHANYRQFGYATALMRYIETTCGTQKLFTSTNLSNLPMQRLLEKLGYSISGVVHNLDEGDPEVIYFKRPAQSTEKSGYNTAQLPEKTI